VLPRTLSRYYSYTAFGIVLLGALFSAWRLSRKGASDERLRRIASGNALIAAGTFVVAAASIAVRLGRGPSVAAVFSAGLLAGITTMFAGFLRTRPRPERSSAAEAAPAAASPA
jgi:peptidoglycan/LPS O-acetylase OafA/YrhL